MVGVSFNGSVIEYTGSNSLAQGKTMYWENFNRYGPTDGDDIDAYDTDWAKTVAGTSVCDIDSAQKLSGAFSLNLHKDGVNACNCQYDSVDMYDYTRFTVWVRAEDTDGRLDIMLADQADGNERAHVYFHTDGKVYAVYGNGSGGNNTIDCGTYAADSWVHEITIDINLTDDTYRVWYKGVLFEGSNSSNDGFDNFSTDRTSTKLDRIKFDVVTQGTSGDFWVADLDVSLGDPTFQYGNAPWGEDDSICEAVASDGSMAGDWARTYGSSGNPAVDNTDYIIGTQSIYLNCVSNDVNSGIKYTFDTEPDVTNYEGVEGYIKVHSASGIPDNYCRLLIKDDPGGGQHYVDIKGDLTDGYWYYFRMPWADMLTGGDGGLHHVTKFQVYSQYSGGSPDVEYWLDGVHFYGARNGRGSAWSSQSIQTETGVTTQLNRSVAQPLQHSGIVKGDKTLEHYFPLHSDILDHSGHGYDLTDGDAITYVGNPNFGGDWDAADFNGTSDYLVRSGNAELETLTNYTQECMFNTDTVAGGPVYVWVIWGTDADRLLVYRNGTSLYFKDDINAGNATYFLDSIVVGRDYHLKIVIDSTNNDLQVYLDGKLKVDISYAKDFNTDMANADIYIGAGFLAAAVGGFWDGQIYDWADYSEAKTQDFAMERAGAGKDLYIDDSKSLTVLASGTDRQRGHRFPEKPNDWCEGDTANWVGENAMATAETSITDAVYGSKSMRFTRTTGGIGRGVYKAYSLSLDLQRIAGSKSTNARYGKVVFWMRASAGSTEYISNMWLYFGGSGNINQHSDDHYLTTYWKKYEIELSTFGVVAGTPDWSDVDAFRWEVNGGSQGDTVDINDLHFEERCVTDRSTASGQYDCDMNATTSYRYSEFNNIAMFDARLVGGYTVDIRHSTFNASGSYGIWSSYNTSTLILEDCIIENDVATAAMIFQGGYSSISVSLCEFIHPVNDLYVATMDLEVSNCIFDNVHVSSQSCISYNHNNVNGEHKAFGTVPFTNASVSDFPRSKTRLTNSSKGWAIFGGLGVVNQSQDGSLFLTNDDGADISIEAETMVTSPIDVGAQADTNHPNNCKIKIKTDNGDANWVLAVYLSTAGQATDFLRYDSAQTNDIDTTVTIDCSGAPDASSGSTDRTDINYVSILLVNIADGGELVRVWVDEIYLETDASKIMLAEENSTVESFCIDPQAGSTVIWDEGSTHTWDDTAGSGFKNTMAGDVLFLGASGNTVSMTSENTPPTNYWNADVYDGGAGGNGNFDIDYATLSYYTELLTRGTVAVDNVTLDHSENDGIAIHAATTVTSLTHITISDSGAKGMDLYKDLVGLDTIVISNPGGVDIYVSSGHTVEMLNSTFTPSNCDMGGTGKLAAKDTTILP